MDQKYSSKLYSKRKANDYLSRFCVRISSRSLAKKSAGTSGDHGSSFLRLSRLLFGLTDGITDNNHFRYLPGFRPLTLAVCTMESQPALTSAPISVKLNREFFLQITKGCIEFSTVLLSTTFPKCQTIICPTKSVVWLIFGRSSPFPSGRLSELGLRPSALTKSPVLPKISDMKD